MSNFSPKKPRFFPPGFPKHPFFAPFPAISRAPRPAPDKGSANSPPAGAGPKSGGSGGGRTAGTDNGNGRRKWTAGMDGGNGIAASAGGLLAITLGKGAWSEAAPPDGARVGGAKKEQAKEPAQEEGGNGAAGGEQTAKVEPAYFINNFNNMFSKQEMFSK